MLNSHTPAAIDLLEKLVSFDTTSSKSNRPLIEWVAQYVRELGLTPVIIESSDHQKANLWVKVGEGSGGVVLSGHTDVVPVIGQPWSQDPWTLTQIEGNLYGRGSADMKGFIAASLALLTDFIESPLAAPIYLALSYDEEVGGLGVPSLIASLIEHGATPDAVLVGEPTELSVVTAQKATYGARTCLRGAAAHSSNPDKGLSAILPAAEIALFLKQLQTQYSNAAAPDTGFDPPYSLSLIHI